MATPSLSSTTQEIGHAGYCVLSFVDPGGTGNIVSVSFIPTLVRIPQPQYAPLQRVNMAVNGSIHIFSYGTQEELRLQTDFTDLPWSQSVFQNTGRFTDGVIDLLSFVRTTLNYHENLCTLMTPDGAIETVRYMGGIESLVEATGQTQKVQFWTGRLMWFRYIA